MAQAYKDDCCTEEAAKTEGYVKKYKSGVATVLYLSGTSRPDLAKFASELGKVQHRPGKKHMAVLKNVIRFIKGTKSYGIAYGKSGNPVQEVIGYADASWIDQVDDRRSTGGYIAFANGGPVSCFSRILKAVALSSAEAELYAACLATQDMVHLRRVMSDITGVKHRGPSTLHEDNQAVIAILRTGKNMQMKYIGKTQGVHIAWLHETCFLNSDIPIMLRYTKTENM